MSFLSDAFHGNFSHLGTDLEHAGSSFANHPAEWAETAGAAAALATGGMALGALPELGAGAGLLGGADAGGGILTGGAALGVDPAAYAGASEAATQGLGFGTQAAGDVGSSALAGVNDAGAGVEMGAVPGGGGSGALNPMTGANAAGENPLLGDINASPVTGTPGGAAPPSGGGMLDTLTSPSQWTLGGVGKVGGALAAGAGLGYNLMNRGQVDPNQQKLQDLAGQLGSQGQVLESYLKTGKLPPALQAQLDQAKASEKARIISGYAQRGQPTDPNMNSALAQELNNVDTNAIAMMAQVQVQMLNTGLKETGMSMELYQMLTQLDMKQNEDLMKSISSFAAALGGGFGGAPARAA